MPSFKKPKKAKGTRMAIEGRKETAKERLAREKAFIARRKAQSSDSKN